jgi:hypothetical protein
MPGQAASNPQLAGVVGLVKREQIEELPTGTVGSERIAEPTLSQLFLGHPVDRRQATLFRL